MDENNLCHVYKPFSTSFYKVIQNSLLSCLEPR